MTFIACGGRPAGPTDSCSGRHICCGHLSSSAHRCSPCSRISSVLAVVAGILFAGRLSCRCCAVNHGAAPSCRRCPHCQVLLVLCCQQELKQVLWQEVSRTLQGWHALVQCHATLNCCHTSQQADHNSVQVQMVSMVHRRVVERTLQLGLGLGAVTDGWARHDWARLADAFHP